MEPATEGRAASAPAVEAGSVRFSAERIEALDGGHPVIRVARKEIDQVVLQRGFQAARPLVQAAIGGVLLGVGAWVVVNLLAKLFFYGGWFVPKLEGLLLTLIPVGGWLLATALRRGYYLEIRSRKGRDKIPFARELPREEIEAFLLRAEQMYGYVVRKDLPEATSGRAASNPPEPGGNPIPGPRWIAGDVSPELGTSPPSRGTPPPALLA